MELLNLGFQVFIQQEQHLNRAVDVAAASRNDLVGKPVSRPGLHIQSPARATRANIAG